MQQTIVVIIIALSAVFVLWRLYRLYTSATDPCAGCDGCALKETRRKKVKNNCCSDKKRARNC